jgi:hypothetical protein
MKYLGSVDILLLSSFWSNFFQSCPNFLAIYLIFPAKLGLNWKKLSSKIISTIQSQHNLLLFLCLLNAACQKEYEFKNLPNDEVNHHLVVLAKVKDGYRLLGLKNASPKNTEVLLEVGTERQSTKSLADGSFDLVIKTNTTLEKGKITFYVGQKSLIHIYTIKDLSLAIKNISQKPFITNTETSAIDFSNNNNEVYILSSTAALLKKYKLDDEWQFTKKPEATWALNKDNNEAQGARDIKAFEDNILLSFFNTHEVMLLNAKNSEVKDKARLLDSKGHLFTFALNPPLALNEPLDEGAKDKIINTSTARNAESLLALDDQYFLASFINYYQYADANISKKAILGPGVLGLFAIKNNRLHTIATLILPFKNPIQMVKGENDVVHVLCAGAWQIDGNNFSSTDGGIIAVEIPNSRSYMAIKTSIPFKDFTPARFTIMQNKIIIPRLWGNDILVLDKSAKSISQDDFKSPSYHRPFHFTFAKEFSESMLMIGDNQGSLIVYSLTDGFFPFPFIDPIPLVKDSDINIALIPTDLYSRHQLDDVSYKIGFNIWVNTAIHKLYPLDFLAVFGP